MNDERVALKCDGNRGIVRKIKGLGGLLTAWAFVLVGQLMLAALTLKLAGSLPSLMAWSRMR